MSTQKAKFELFARLQNLGFTYNEAVSLRRIEMTLQRWAQRECGDGSDWAVERDEKTGKPFNVYHGLGARADAVRSHRVADRETGALKRAKYIVAARNARLYVDGKPVNQVTFYHQTDPRGCMLYIVPISELPIKTDGPVDGPDYSKLDAYYTRGVAVCC